MPNDTEKPRSMQDLAIDSLPHWARVAIQSRAARRVLPIVGTNRQSAAKNAIITAEISATTATPCDRLHDYAHAAWRAANMNDVLAESQAVYTAFSACRSAHSPKQSKRSPNAVDEALMAAIAFPERDYNLVFDAIKSDLDILRDLSDRDRWNDNSPVDPDWVGRLWLGERPKFSPPMAEDLTGPLPCLEIKISIPPHIKPGTPEMAKVLDKLADFYAALSAAYVATGDGAARDLVRGR